MSEITLTSYVTYFVSQSQWVTPHPIQDDGFGSKTNVHPLFNNAEETPIPDSQQKAINEYIEPRKLQTEIVGSFIEILESRRTSKWPQLEKAISLCQERGAKLLIAELGTLTNNETFTQLLLDADIPFHCCDQPFVNQTILEALYKHAQVQRKLHGKLIREGLKMTSAKSGNPNAAEVISKVNKPKIDTAILFAFLLQPIIIDYRRKGYSQRQMVKTLNEEGFTAPEGGKWVLSQLQKVLDRVRLNEVALEVKPLIEESQAKELTEMQIAEELNSKGIASLKRAAWDEAQVKKLLARLDQIKDIESINQFALDIIPILHEYQHRQLSPTDMVNRLAKIGISIRQNYAIEAA